MKLKSITIKNFKSIGEEGLTVDLSPITLLFGPNNAGKSTIIKALYLAHKIFCEDDPRLDRIDEVGLGNFENYVYGHDLDRNISIVIKWTITECQIAFNDKDLEFKFAGINIKPHFYRVGQMVKFYEYNQFSIGFSICYDKELDLAHICNLSFYLDDIAFVVISFKSDIAGQNKYLATISKASDLFLGRIASYAYDYEQLYGKKFLVIINEYKNKSAFSLHLNKFGVPKFEDWRYDYEFIEDTPSTFTEMVTDILSSLINPFRALLKQYFQICALRVIPDSIKTRQSGDLFSEWQSGIAAWKLLYDLPSDAVARINSCLNGPGGLGIGYSIDIQEYCKLDVKSDLYAALKKIGNGEETAISKESVAAFFNQIPLRELWLLNLSNRTRIHPADAGTGVSQIMPVVVAAIATPANSLVAIEQPELHIHPAWQVALGDIFIDAIQREPERIFVVETHSEHLLLRLRRRVHEYYEYQRSLREGAWGENCVAKPDHPLKASDLAIYWISNKDGATRAERVHIDDEGYFETSWPEGFFEERDAELFG